MDAKRKRTKAGSPGDSSRPTSRELKAAVRREQILSTALRLFCEHGYAGTSTREIARAVGVTEGLLFHYFPSKEQLLFEVAARQTSFAGRVLASFGTSRGKSAREVMAEISDGFVDVSSEDLAFVGFMLAEAQINADLRAKVVAANEMVLGLVETFFVERIEAGELREGIAIDVALQGFFGGFLFFFTQNRHRGAAAWRAAARAFSDAWAEQCWRGLATPRAVTAHERKSSK